MELEPIKYETAFARFKSLEQIEQMNKIEVSENNGVKTIIYFDQNKIYDYKNYVLSVKFNSPTVSILFLNETKSKTCICYL